MRNICVYAGSNPGVRQEYAQTARELGVELVRRGLGLVYGGGRVGLMGILAEAVTAAGGEVIGVMPSALFPREVAYTAGTRFYEVKSMHERKALMADLSDGFIALPGGYGTYDELFEIMTWAQLGLHAKPVGLLNVANFFDPLLALIAHSATEGFISSRHSAFVLQQTTPAALLDSFAVYQPVASGSKWSELPER
ncbi:MAG TPA: TIGR00730 family Rossman fold protein [Ktedonobacteraceae bacterium]|nr:TIGR00730 family Rossman fold protein [Ktedonobacteraceae bacterium]